jgi:hypothetical protein
MRCWQIVFMSHTYSIPLVQKSDSLTKKENKLLIEFSELCYSIAEEETSYLKKTHIRDSVFRLLQRTLCEKADSHG